MNLYFWLFVLYGILIMPISAQVHVRIERGLHYRIRIRAAGLPVVRKRKEEEQQEEIRMQSRDVMKGMKNWDAGLFLMLLRQGHLLRLVRLFEWHDVEIRSRISFEDAAATAMVYALIRIFLQSMARIRPMHIRGRIEMNFQGEGSIFSLRCIAQTRLGSLMAAAIRLWPVIAGYRMKQLKTEEEQHAAASH